MKIFFFLLTALIYIIFLNFACYSQVQPQLNYSISSEYVEQDSFIAQIESPTLIRSNYKDGFTKSTSAVVRFKFSINGKDNERPSREDHFILINPVDNKYTSPVIKFGTEFPGEESLLNNEIYLPKNSSITVTFRVDFNSVLSSFSEKGYFETFSGNKISSEQFTGLYIAGETEPLSWNFGEIQKNSAYQMLDEDGDGIYECQIIFKTNDYRSIEENGFAVWKLKEDISEFPKYESSIVLQQALYNMSLEELLYDIRPDSTFMAGAKWHGVWTRDISYSIYLSLGLIEPEVAKKSLLKKVNRGRIIQDTGTGGSWPISTDRMVWAIAAWEVFLATGDTNWLRTSYEIIKNSVESDIINAHDKETSLVFGESSFLDWREQSYPKWMDPKDIYSSRNLGTNALHYRMLMILNEMGKELGIHNPKYYAIAEEIKSAINDLLWIPGKNYYSQFLYGRTYDYLSPKSETLGEALAILFDIADGAKSEKIIESMPVTNYGPSCFFPQINGIPPYHNNAIWPFVVSYWSWAASKTNNETAVQFGMESIYRAASLFLTNKENMVAETGHFVGTEINSDRMLWSIAGNLATIYRIMFGINLSSEGISFTPFIPKEFNGTHKLSNLKYRNAVLDIVIHGCGSGIQEAYIDKQKVDAVFLENSIQGHHSIEIFLNNSESGGSINLVNNHIAPSTPEVNLQDESITWTKVNNADYYKIFKNGNKLDEIKTEHYSITKDFALNEYSVAAVDKDGYESFISEPVLVITNSSLVKHESKNKSDFIHMSKEDTSITVNYKKIIDREGLYSIDFRYANGNGPINTYNACGIRSLYLNGDFLSVIVFPQRGEENWDDWGYSNLTKVFLKKGEYEFELKYRPINENMNIEKNEALVDGMRLTLLHQ